MEPSDVAGRRIGAALLDLSVYVAGCAAVFFVMADSTQGVVYLEAPQFHIRLGDTLFYVDGAVAQVYWLLTVALAFAQFGVLPGLTGWTPGKLALGLRVLRPDGARPGVARNLLRAVMWIVDGFPYFIPGLVGFVMLLARPDRRRVADLAAETVVAGRDWRGAPAAASPPTPAWVPAGGPESPR